MGNSKLNKIKTKNPMKNRFSKITEDLYWARIPLPFRLDHVNVYAINSNELGLIDLVYLLNVQQQIYDISIEESKVHLDRYLIILI